MLTWDTIGLFCYQNEKKKKKKNLKNRKADECQTTTSACQLTCSWANEVSSKMPDIIKIAGRDIEKYEGN